MFCYCAGSQLAHQHIPHRRQQPRGFRRVFAPGSTGFCGLAIPSTRDSSGRAAYEGDSLTVQLFEDNGRETGIEGKLITVSSILRERFAWASLRSSVLAFITSLLLIWRGLKQEPLLAGIYSFAIVLVFTVLETGISYFLERGKIGWKLRQGSHVSSQ
jgi:hypothetical protein